MQKVILPNGLTVLFQKKKGAAVVVQMLVKVGSNNESVQERGLAHFLEHMLFEGTVTRPTNRSIANEIEKIGGDFNAYTSNERTSYYVKILNKHFTTGVRILADILQNSLFMEEHITKEKQIVVKEIDLVRDEPSFYQWVLLHKLLFKNHPLEYPAYGSKSSIMALNRKKVVEFFSRHYTSNNMVLVIVGDIEGWKKTVQQYFPLPKGKVLTSRNRIPKPLKKNVIKKEKKSSMNTYTILGFVTAPRKHPDAYVLEVINGILGRGQSGRMFTEIRSKLGLAYDVGTQHVAEVSFGYFAVHATIDKKNLSKVRALMLNELEKLQQITEKDLRESITFIEGNYLLELEDPQKLSDQLAFWHQVEKAQLLHHFVSKIKQVSKADVKRVAKKYFTHYGQVILEGK